MTLKGKYWQTEANKRDREKTAFIIPNGPRESAVCGQGLSEKLLKQYFRLYKVLRQVGEVDYEVVPDRNYQPLRRRPHPEVVHVVRLIFRYQLFNLFS